MAFDTFLFLDGIDGESTATIESPPLAKQGVRNHTAGALVDPTRQRWDPARAVCQPVK